MGTQPNDEIEPRRIGKSTREGMAPARGFRVGGKGSRTRETTQHEPLPQRVSVKVRVVRHRSPPKGRSSLRAHIRYLSRESVAKDGVSGRFYDAKKDELDPRKETLSWREDRHHFRVILSPENGNALPDLRTYVRDVMRRVEHDLGPLDWMAVDHRNTNHSHSHILIRGRSADGSDLVMARDYISHGIRDRAQQVATKMLGERTLNEAQASIAADVTAERFTSLDRTLIRLAESKDGMQINLSKRSTSRYALTSPELLAGRLKFLRQIGLAEPITTGIGIRPQHRHWKIDAGFEARLRDLGERHDITKQLYRTLGQKGARMAQGIQRLSVTLQDDKAEAAAVRGVLVSKGALDESSDERFLVVRDSRDKTYYARVWQNKAYEAAEIGGIIEVAGRASRRQQIIREIISVAGANGSQRYSTGDHRAWLRANRADLRPEQIERRLRKYSKAVSRYARERDSGVTHASENAVGIDPYQLRRHAERQNRWLDFRPIAPHSLEKQITAEAYTWLDRQIIRGRLTDRVSASDVIRVPAVMESMQKRAEWLVQHGFAELDPDSKSNPAVRFQFDAIDRLNSLEQKKFAQDCKNRYRKDVSFLRAKDMVNGVYVGVRYLQRGTYSIVATKERLFAVPVSRDPEIPIGQVVSARVVSRGHSELQRHTKQEKVKGLGLNR